MHPIRPIILLSISLFASLCSYAQRNAYPIDTIDLKATKVVLYSDNTWKYLYAKTNTVISKNPDDLSKDNWDTQQIFGYLKERGQHHEYHYDMSQLEGETITVPISGHIYGGFRNGHDGVDISLRKGDAIKATYDGKVRYAQFHKHGYGNLVVIRHYNGLETWYSHLDKISVKANQEVKSGDLVGTGGRTGRAFADHLHFETRYHDKPMNPENFFDFSKDGNQTQDNSVAEKSIEVPTIKSKNGNTKLNTLTSDTKKKANKEETNKKDKKAKTYTVKKGDSLSKIAEANHTSVEEICKANGIKKDAVLSLGKKLKLGKSKS